MVELIADMLTNPPVWAVFLVLSAVCWIALWVRFKFGRPAVALAMLGLWLALTTAAQMFHSNYPMDGRFWVHNGVSIAAAIGPLLLFVVSIPNGVSRGWIIAGALVSALIGAVALLVVALITVCALGIDCL